DAKPKQSIDVLKERLLSNSTYFTKYEIPGILNYTLDINKLNTLLKSSSIKIFPAGGSASRDLFPYGCAATLAEQLDTEIVEFPGHHGGFDTTHPEEFAERLHNVLATRIFKRYNE
ncbi:alpha/beta hydrolase, partial [Priestia megaterium]|nr:alpha/beta hydrolase [Priestia megaterium]